MLDAPLGRRLRASLLAAALLAVAALGAAAAIATHRHLDRKQAQIMALHELVADAYRKGLLVSEGEAKMRAWLLSGRAEDRDASARATAAMRETGRELAGRLEPVLLARGLPPLGTTLEHLIRLREQTHQAAEAEGPAAARDAALRAGGAGAAENLRGVLAELRALVEQELAVQNRDLQKGQVTGLLLIGSSFVLMLALLLAAVVMLARGRAAAERGRAAIDRRGQEVAALFRMGELLQSSVTQDDVRRVVAHTAQELLPGVAGALFVFSNSRDRLDLLTSWQPGAGAAVPRLEHFGPNECWALKRGRPHGCGIGGGLQCDHAAASGRCGLCVPMQARGEVYGVLQFFPPATPGPAEAELAGALADGVSLALANLALREKLRNQALRDELTGLYNRRFLEETLSRMVAHAERRSAPIAVLMLDLDHFKQVNDRYGHAVGDAVLREVGGLLLAGLRRMDIACRYGGEELLVLMPDCGAADALARAQEIVALVRSLRDRAETALPAVTVSIGVAAWPEHGEQIGRVIEAADSALYQAKRSGRDRAVPAEATVPALALPG